MAWFKRKKGAAERTAGLGAANVPKPIRAMETKDPAVTPPRQPRAEGISPQSGNTKLGKGAPGKQAVNKTLPIGGQRKPWKPATPRGGYAGLSPVCAGAHRAHECGIIADSSPYDLRCRSVRLPRRLGTKDVRHGTVPAAKARTGNRLR